MTPFITTTSGGGEFYVTIKVSSLDELHRTHDTILSAFSPTDTQEGLSEAGERCHSCRGEKSSFLNGVCGRCDGTGLEPSRQSALTACQQEVERLQAENASLGSDGVAARRAAALNLSRADTAEARILELETDLEIERDKLRRLTDAFRAKAQEVTE